MQKLISIITINYNDKKGLQKTIKSVVSQTYQDFEYIVIDGGSTDGGKEILEQNCEKIDYWVSEPDKGIYNAMNKAIKVAKGDFLIFMNSGDTFFNEKVLEHMEKELIDDYDIYYGDYYRVNKNSTKKRTFPEKLSFSFFYSGTLSHQSSFIRRKLFFDFFLYNEDYKIASDWEFFIYAICYKNVPYKYLNLTISNFDFTGVSSISKYKNLSIEERRQTVNKYFPLFAEDYELVSVLKSKRFLQILHIQKFPFAWKIVKAVINIILIFIPKLNK
jgi:glycosyltransferase involved in cell wall biosynthesis